MRFRFAQRSPDSMSDNLLAAIIISGCAVAVAWIVWVIATNIRRSRASKQVTELHSRLLDRFAGNAELIAFLEGESGRRYFEALESGLSEPLSRILNGIQAGIVLLLLGIALVAIGIGQNEEFSRNALLFSGIPAIALGAGFLISAAISHRLSKAWGLLDRNGRRTP